ncbi:MAG: hypothetical protein HZA27_00860 [Candidatus Omnitrophica bacterium]|nr:hypothetical protein [Candidatus Omnitrophota bacterium]
MTQDINIFKVIYLYNEGIKKFDFKTLKDFLEDNFGKIKVYLIRLKSKVVHTQGLLFDLRGTKKAFEAGGYAKDEDACHIVLTERLFATLGQDRRPHIRASIYSFPSVISTSGIVEGPAKPKEFYLYKQKYTSIGAWDIKEAGIKKKFKSRFIDYRDTRLTEVLKGYIAQAIFFYIFGEPFCQHKNCRLFNAHWQEDLIHAQIKHGKFCKRHRKFLTKIKTACPYGRQGGLK